MEPGDGEGHFTEGNRIPGAFSGSHNHTNAEATIIKTTYTHSIVLYDGITDPSQVCILQSVSPVHHLDCQGSRGQWPLLHIYV